MMKRNTMQLKLFFLAFILLSLFSARLYANDFARADCLFDIVEEVFPDYFYPHIKTKTFFLQSGIEYVRTYPNEYQAALYIIDSNVWYGFYGQFTYYGTIDEANQIVTNGACSNVESSLAIRPISSHAYVKSSVIWQSSEINVCWENPSSGNAYFRTIVKSAVEGTWAKESVLKFIGWKQCSSSSQGIRIVWMDDVPHTRGLGTQLNGVRNGMSLNYEFNNWSPSCKSKQDYCVRVIAVHEFGHALGFAHEQNRPDTPSSPLCSDDQRQGYNGDIVIGAWDLDSVMNYCNPKYSNDGNLSKTDILAVQHFYGLPNITTQCTYSISPTTQSFASSGGTGTVTVTTQTGCQWNAASNSGWIRVSSGNSGNGNGTISYSVSANSNSSATNISSSGILNPRTGTISVAGKTLTITQSGVTKPTCSYQISPTTQSFSSTGGMGSVNVTTQAGCQWNASSNAGWISVIYGTHGNGNGTVSYSVSTNSKSSGTSTSSNSSSRSRTGTLTVAGKTLTVTQSGIVATKPTAPQRMFAAALSSRSVKVSWTDNSNNENGFHIYRWNGNTWLKIATVGANTTFYTDTGLQGGTTYNYTVTAYNSAGENGYSNYVSATTMSQSYLESLVD